MKIVSLVAENVKKLVAVEIKPDGNLVEITGKNGQGKTSVLDSIWWALDGADHIQSAPIRKGADRARIRLDLGEIIVTRTFTRKEGGATTSITVENADGARFPSPQKMLDSLLGALTFDPLAFARMKPREQFDTLRKFVPDVDFDAIEKANADDFARRKEVNKFAKDARAHAEMISVPADTPDEEINETELVDQIQDAGTKNTELERRKNNREKHRAKIESLRTSAQSAIDRIDARKAEIEQKLTRDRADIEQQIAALKARLEAIEDEAVTEMDRVRAECRAEQEQATKEADEMQFQLDSAEPLPSPIDVSELRAKLDQARATNAHVKQLAEKRKYERLADQYERESDELTARRTEREQQKQAAIAKAHMPIDGIGFGDGYITLAGVPFDQGSDAEQLRACVAIVAAMNPKLRVIRVRDGSLLDDNGMKLLADIADEKDMQVWVERVDSSGKIGFVLEDGRLKKAEQAGEAA